MDAATLQALQIDALRISPLLGDHRTAANQIATHFDELAAGLMRLRDIELVFVEPVDQSEATDDDDRENTTLGWKESIEGSCDDQDDDDAGEEWKNEDDDEVVVSVRVLNSSGEVIANAASGDAGKSEVRVYRYINELLITEQERPLHREVIRTIGRIWSDEEDVADAFVAFVDEIVMYCRTAARLYRLEEEIEAPVSSSISMSLSADFLVSVLLEVIEAVVDPIPNRVEAELISIGETSLALDEQLNIMLHEAAPV